MCDSASAWNTFSKNMVFSKVLTYCRTVRLVLQTDGLGRVDSPLSHKLSFPVWILQWYFHMVSLRTGGVWAASSGPWAHTKKHTVIKTKTKKVVFSWADSYRDVCQCMKNTTWHDLITDDYRPQNPSSGIKVYVCCLQEFTRPHSGFFVIIVLKSTTLIHCSQSFQLNVL